MSSQATETYPAVEAVFDRVDHRAFVAEFASHADEYRAMEANLAGDISSVDGIVTYAVAKKFRPKRVMQVGAGDSTHIFAEAASDADVICIDPQPHEVFAGLPVQFLRRAICAGDTSLVEQLHAGDILFLDSGRIMQQGGGVDIAFNRFFPALRPGVLVHVPEIYLPDGYPKKWDGHRGWNEQNSLIGWIVPGFFKVIFASHYAATRQPDLFGGPLAGMSRRRHPTGLWLQRATAV